MAVSSIARLRIAVAALLVAASATAGVDPAIQRRVNALAVPFVPNAGQWDGRVAFAAQTFGGTLFVTGSGRIVLRTLTETLVDEVGRALPLTPRAVGLRDGKVSYAIGADESKHRDALPTYERIELGDVVRGIRVQLRASGANVEKIFT